MYMFGAKMDVVKQSEANVIYLLVRDEMYIERLGSSLHNLGI